MLITSCNHEKARDQVLTVPHSVLDRRKRRAGGITICPDYIRPPRPNRSQCPDSCIRPYPEFWPFCPDKIRHRPSQEDDFVRIVYEAFKRHCRGSFSPLGEPEKLQDRTRCGAPRTRTCCVPHGVRANGSLKPPLRAQLYTLGRMRPADV